MVNVSKAGALSLILGLVVLAGTHLMAFSQAGIIAMLVSAAIGALVLLGVFLVVLGLIMLLL